VDYGNKSFEGKVDWGCRGRAGMCLEVSCNFNMELVFKVSIFGKIAKYRPERGEGLLQIWRNNVPNSVRL
jgi:hypothetical protein